jgi:hypothetical protein
MSRNVLTLCFISLLLCCSCAPRKVVAPAPERADLRQVIEARDTISAIDMTFAIAYEKDEAGMRGDGAATIWENGDLQMRVYYLGFLAFEMSAENGVIKSTPPIDWNRRTILAYGLRDCMFWWDVKDYRIETSGEELVIMNKSRQVWIDPKTFLPLRQAIRTDDGREIRISYDAPERSGDFWYPSRIRIELARYAVDLKVKEQSFISSADRDLLQPSQL